jgi:NAD(P)-dependent dehydrogenase (short-subunit alcohol dehydrogenase family)
MHAFFSRRRALQAALFSILAPSPRFASAQTPRSTFGAQSTAEEVTQGLDLTGKTALVTGCNSGIGYETMRVLALRGAHVIGTARTPEKGAEACGRIKGKATPVVLELTDFDTVAACADDVRKLQAPLDMLICNAGIALNQLEQVNGLEKQFVVNHLGHFVLVNRLLDLVTTAPQGRIVVVGSRSHFNAPPGGIQFERLSGKGWQERAYSHSKLANGLFSLELSRRLKDGKATSNCLHPGGVRTNISPNARNYPKSVEQGAATTCYVATHPSLRETSGEYFSDCNPAPQSDDQKDEAMARRLWDVSAELTRKYL